MGELDSKQTLPGSGFAQFLTEMKEALSSREEGSFLQKSFQNIEVDKLTIENPNYWRAALEIGEERLLLFWLHAVLLAREKRMEEAIEWSIFLRQTAYIPRELDQKWLAWENNILRRNPVAFGMVEAVGSADDLINSVASGRPEIVSLGGRPTFVVRSHPLSLEPQDYRQSPRAQPKLRAAYAKTPPDAEAQSAVGFLFERWPFQNLLRPFQLNQISGWLESANLSEFALVTRLQTLDLTAGYEDTFLQTAWENHLGSDFPSTIHLNSSRSHETTSTRWSDEIPPAETGATVHDYLRKNTTQAVRRLESIEPRLKRLTISSERFYTTLATHYITLGQVTKLQRAVQRIRDVSFSPTVINKWELRYAIATGDPANTRRSLQRLQRVDPKSQETAHHQALAAVNLELWPEAYAAYHTKLQQSLEHGLHQTALYDELILRALAELGSLPPPPASSALQRADVDHPWQNHLAMFSRGEISREELLAAAQTEDPFEASERICEAQFYLAAAPGVEAAERYERLKACVETGQVNFIEYQFAQALLQRYAEPISAQ
ncbi:MAG: hypothetical protein SynsKO_03330 [Synoicihabitans sp.]